MSKNRILGYGAREKSKILFHTLSVGIALIILSSLQVSFFGRFRFFGAVPDLMLCFVLCISYFLGPYAGAITGIASGFVIEAIGSQGISLLPLIYFLYGYCVGSFSHTSVRKGYAPYILYLVCGLFLRATVTLIYVCLIYKNIQLPVILLYSVLPEWIVTAVWGCIVYLPMKLFCTWIIRKTKS